MRISAGFNPRTHEECDRFFWDEAVSLNVSIHALTRSATRGAPASAVGACFNPRTHEECDIMSMRKNTIK